MNTSADSTRVWKVRLGWIVLLLVVGAPLAFFFLVTPEEPADESAPAVVKLPPSKLAAVGLRENRDWDGLPEMFAVWADKLEWRYDKVRFGYWNPGTSSYSYFFEANRRSGKLRFREVSRAEFSKLAGYPFLDEAEKSITEEVPLVREPAPSHPFLFDYPSANKLIGCPYYPPVEPIKSADKLIELERSEAKNTLGKQRP